ncbi:pentatricopeptide repeat-containing protein At1g26460, mitochondrial-like [Neltuma alba]|uniref:pentatricopeptide repeat-containing protein At1g26460, mitochondrial-like n=1 Tax=Neltuma alba TaxID=207710 RepID=UPI0010A474AB|nr:pentatricopeptide repeat-containing protein At1g26460, mitochondrial-like [Prosopis alba]
MASQMAIIARTRSLIKTLHSNCANTSVKTITTFPFVSQEPQLAESPAPAAPTPLPPNPASGSPLYNENWRNPNPPSSTQSVIPLGFLNLEWAAIKELFESWVKSLGKSGKPNKPDLEWRILVSHLIPTASFNLVLKAMYHARETEAAQKLLERMLLTGNESRPDNESYDLVIGMLFLTGQIDAALKYIDLALKSSYMLSMNVFTSCVNSCISKGRLDTLAAIIEKCKTMDQNKALCPPWNVCYLIAETAMQQDNSKLAYYALEFMAMWIARGELARLAALLSVDEGLIVSALATAGRTYSSSLLDAAWTILRRTLRQRKAPNPESYLGKINALASMGNLQRAFSTLHDFELLMEIPVKKLKKCSLPLLLYIHWLWHAPRRDLRVWILFIFNWKV